MSIMVQGSKVLPASKVKSNFGSLVKKVQSGEYTEIIVENHGQPVAAIVDIGAFEAMKTLKEKERRLDALEQLKKARAAVQAKLQRPLSDQDAMALADRFSHEVVDDLAKEKKLQFERDEL